MIGDILSRIARYQYTILWFAFAAVVAVGVAVILS